MLLSGWAVAASLVWLALHANTLRQVRLLPELDDLSSTMPDVWPTVSVLVAARNEVDSIEQAIESLRDQTYPALEIVVADDRSTDGTGDVLDDLAARDERIRVVHIEELPEDWLGKLHALYRAKEISRGDWLLMTDADVEHEPGLIRAAVGAALGEGADHLTCMPRMRDHDCLMEAAYAAFFLGMFQRISIAGIEDPEGDHYVGIGAFNLVRRSLFERAGGFEELRMEVADDIGVGLLVQRASGVSRIATAFGRLEVTWYDSLGEMVRGLEKNGFAAIGRFSYLRVAAYTALWLFVFFGPVVGLTRPVPAVVVLSAAVLALHPLVSVAAAVALDRRPGPFSIRIVGEWIMIYVLLRSAYMCWRRGGICWRGTTYPVDRLRAQQRVRL